MAPREHERTHFPGIPKIETQNASKAIPARIFDLEIGIRTLGATLTGSDLPNFCNEFLCLLGAQKISITRATIRASSGK